MRAMAHNHDLLKELATENRELRELIPDSFAGFAQMHKTLGHDGALPALTKELIALGMSIGTQCDGCIASHARGAARKGATSEQVAEVIGVAMLMAGGPATVYGPRAWKAFKEFSST